MKIDGKYRFNLQFPAETEEQIQAGELLERVGNRKSAIVVEALSAYLQSHPEVLGAEKKIEIHSTPKYDREEIEQMIRRAVQEHFQSDPSLRERMPLQISEDDISDDISEMLDNLDLFQSL